MCCYSASLNYSDLALTALYLPALSFFKITSASSSDPSFVLFSFSFFLFLFCSFFSLSRFSFSSKRVGFGAGSGPPTSLPFKDNSRCPLIRSILRHKKICMKITFHSYANYNSFPLQTFSIYPQKCFPLLTLYTPRSVCIFFILFSVHFQWGWQGEFV